MRRWLLGLVVCLAPGPAAASARTTAPVPKDSPAIEGPAPPPVRKDSSSVEGPAPPPARKDSSSVEGPAPPPARKDSTPGRKDSKKPTPEGPAQLPPPTGARVETERGWLAEQPGDGGESSSRGGLGLTRQRDGSMLYVDPGKRFTAAVNPDGSVRFGNRWGRDQHGERMRGSGAALRSFGPTGIGGVGMAMTGPTEWLLFLSGQEFDAAAKTRFLNQTRDLRIQLAVAFTMQLLDTRLSELNQELLGLWSDPSRSLVERRALVFQRWDECDERLVAGLPAGADLPPEATSAIDQARLDAADRARRTIEGFIRRQMPRGSPRAYTPGELAEFNRGRVSVETFAPYEPRAITPRTTPPKSTPPVPRDMSTGAAQP